MYPIWVSVEGLIGAGKSTLIDGLPTLLGQNTILVEEPVQQWIDSGILQKAYSNPTVYNFPAQCTFFTSRIKGFAKIYETTPTTQKCFLSERSAFSDIIFWDTQVKLGRVAPDLYDIYKDMWEVFQRLQPMANPTLFVYLRPTLSECMRRMRERGRTEESTVDEEYQLELFRQHDERFNKEWVEMPDGTKVPCVVINSDGNFRDNPQELQKIVKQIENHLLINF